MHSPCNQSLMLSMKDNVLDGVRRPVVHKAAAVMCRRHSQTVHNSQWSDYFEGSFHKFDTSPDILVWYDKRTFLGDAAFAYNYDMVLLLYEHGARLHIHIAHAEEYDRSALDRWRRKPYNIFMPLSMEQVSYRQYVSVNPRLMLADL